MIPIGALTGAHSPADLERERTRFYDLLAVAALAVVGVLVLLTFRDYGVTTDEEVQNEYGKMLLSFYASGFADRTAFSYLNLFYYGGLFDMVAAALNLVSPLGEYETRHLLGGFVGILGAAGTWRLARGLAGPRAGAIATLLVVLTPSLYGHMFNNPKDVPFAAAMVWALHAICRLIPELPRPRLRSVVAVGVTLGLALGVRVGAVLLIGYLGLAVAAWLTVRLAEERRLAPVAADAWTLTKNLIPAAMVAYATMAFCWPWAVLEPLNPLRALTMFSHFPIDLDTLFDGKWYDAESLPALYLPGYLAVKLPELVLFGLASGLAFLAIAPRRLWAATPVADRIGYGMTAFAALFPVVYFIMARPTAYNEMRHFLFVIPPLAALAAFGIEALWRKLGERRAMIGHGFGGVLGVAAAAQAWLMVSLHPNQYVYYNLMTGGVDGAKGRYELDYWGNSLNGAARQLAEMIERQYPDGPKRVFKVLVCGNPRAAAYVMPSFLKAVPSAEQADFLIYGTHYIGCNRMAARPEIGRKLFSVKALGVDLSVIVDMRKDQPSPWPR